MITYILTPLAEQDLIGIWDHIATDSIATANRVLERIEGALGKLARSPLTGHFREDLADRRHRFFLVYSYLIIYRPETKPLQAIRVVRAARDVRALLE